VRRRIDAILCRTCGNEIPYDAAFCEHFGAPVSETAGKTFPETDVFKQEQGRNRTSERLKTERI
jgi:hypothetical protein